MLILSCMKTLAKWFDAQALTIQFTRYVYNLHSFALLIFIGLCSAQIYYFSNNDKALSIIIKNGGQNDVAGFCWGIYRGSHNTWLLV